MLILHLFIVYSFDTIIVCMRKSRNYSLLILLSSIFTMIDVYSIRFGQGLCQVSSLLDSLPFKSIVINFVAFSGIMIKINLICRHYIAIYCQSVQLKHAIYIAK